MISDFSLSFCYFCNCRKMAKNKEKHASKTNKAQGVAQRGTLL